MFQPGEVRSLRGPEVFLGGGEAGAAVQSPRVPAQVFPRVGGFGEFAVCAQTFTLLFNPITQPRPGGQQGFMGELDGVAVKNEQPCLSQSLQNVLGFGLLSAGGLKFLPVGGATGVEGAITGATRRSSRRAAAAWAAVNRP